MRRPIILAAAAAALALSACANDKVWMRSGASSSDAEIDEMSCAEQSEGGGVSVSINGDVGPKTDRFSNRYACLRQRGYKLKSLSSDEAAKLKSLGGVDRETYWSELLAKNGFSPASAKPAEPAPAPAVPPKPSAKATVTPPKPAPVQ